MVELSPSLAIGWCVSQAVALVGSLYLLLPSRVRSLPRDDPEHIRYRAVSMLLSLFISLLGTWWLLGSDSLSFVQGATSKTTFLPLLHFVILFAGPVSALYFLPHATSVTYSHELLIDMRNLFLAPIVEELIFRNSMAVTLLNTQEPRFSRNFILFFPPLLFGAAHIHHWVLAVRRGEMPVKQAVLSMLFQVAYTTLFGALMMDLLLKTENAIAICLIHSWCNFMGFPNFGLICNLPYVKA